MRIFLKRNMVKRYYAFLPKHISSLLVLVLLFASIVSVGISVFLSPVVAEAQGSEKGILHRHHPLVQEAIGVQERNLHWLMRIPDVVGSGVGIGPDGLPAIKVFTARHGVKGIPEWLESTPVQVEVTGMIVALGDTTSRQRPAPIGVSTGHPAITAGTIGARVKDADGNVYALSNNHIYANANNAHLGDSALQPGPFDGGTDTDYYRIGNLHAFQPINFSVFGSNTIDAAIASTTTYMVDYTTPSDGYGAPNSEITAASFGLPVKKYGRTTGMTHGEVAELSVTITVCYANCSNPFLAKLAWFKDQIGIITKDPAPFSLGGDSGSLIVTENGNNPVGLLFAGSDTKTFANRIDLVLSALGVTIDDGAGTTPTPPAAPCTLTATAVSSSQINLTWADNSDNEAGFKIERCQGVGCNNFSQIATVGVGVTTYSNTGLSASTIYTYRVYAYNAGGNSDYSNPSSATTQAPPPLPLAPTTLTATAASRSQINLTWTDNANNEDGFKVERCQGATCTNFKQIATVGPNATSYSNTGLRRNTTYRYRVRAYNPSGNSAYSNIASAKTPW